MLFSFRIFKISNQTNHPDHIRLKTHVEDEQLSTITIGAIGANGASDNRRLKVEAVRNVRQHGLVKFLELANPELSTSANRYILKKEYFVCM